MDADNAEEIYQQLQGNLPDGTPDPDTPALLDVDNLIDFMILHFYGGVEDWPHHNWYASRNRVDPGNGIQVLHLGSGDRSGRSDSEISPVSAPQVIIATRLPSCITCCARTLIHSTCDLPTESTCTFRREEHSASRRIRRAGIDRRPSWTLRSSRSQLVGEDAREGERISIDSGRPAVVVPTITVDQWRAEVANVRDNYMPRLAVETLDNFRGAGLITPLTAPNFNHPGGAVPNGFEVNISAMFADGKETPLVVEGGSATALVPQDGSLDAPGANQSPLWTAPDFDDSNWITGTGGVGFEKGFRQW